MEFIKRVELPGSFQELPGSFQVIPGKLPGMKES